MRLCGLRYIVPRTNAARVPFDLSVTSVVVRTPKFKAVPTEPEEGAWFSTGSELEAYVDGNWYVGTVEWVIAFAKYDLIFPDGDQDYFGHWQLRVLRPYQVGEKV